MMSITKPSVIILNRARKNITPDMTVREAKSIEAARDKASKFYLAALGIDIIYVRMRVYGLNSATDEIIVRRYQDAELYEYEDKTYSKKELEKNF